jgi:uncharacterized protein YneF (UPF0154 family)
MAYLELLRPSNIIILFFGTLLGAFVAIGKGAFFSTRDLPCRLGDNPHRRRGQCH